MQPWFAAPTETASRDSRIVIIGAGLAGCATAAALAKRGYAAQLIDRNTGIAEGTSAVPRAVVKPHISRIESVPSSYFQQSFDFLLGEIERLQTAGEERFYHQTGVLQLVEEHSGWPSNAGAIDQHTASSLAGTSTPAGALHFNHAGWLNPAELCRRWLAESPSIGFTHAPGIDALTYNRDKWQLLAGGKLITDADIVVIASGIAANQLHQSAALPLQISHGQLSKFSVDQPHELRKVITGRGLVIPDSDKLWLGATHERCTAATRADTTAQNRDANLDRLGSLCAISTDRLQAATDWAGLRASTADRLPLVGALPDRDFYLDAYGDLNHGRRPEHYPPARYHPGLFVLAGLGSRGATQAAFAAELLAGIITGSAPLHPEQTILDAIHPGRFFIRALRRGQPIPEHHQ